MVLSFHRRMNELQVHKAGERKRRNQTPFEINRAAGDASNPATVWALIGTLTLSSLTPFFPLACAQQATKSGRLQDLFREGKIYMSLCDAIMLALENYYVIAIARYSLGIADTDILRSRAGSRLPGISTGLVTGTIGGTSTTPSSGGGP